MLPHMKRTPTYYETKRISEHEPTLDGYFETLNSDLIRVRRYRLTS